MLPSRAAARITWAEQAFLNIEQHREGGTEGLGVRDTEGDRQNAGRQAGIRGERKGQRKKGKRTGWTERERRWEKQMTTVTIKDPHLPLVSTATVAPDSREQFSLGHD